MQPAARPFLYVLSRLACLGAALLPALATAADLGPRLSGFGTLAYSVDDSDWLTPMRDISQPTHFDALEDNATWRLDSRLGMQLDYRPSTNTELVAKAVLRDQVRQNLNSVTEMAYLGLRPTDDLSLRLGRVGFDVFLMSDTRNLGYAYTWVRPPQEFHSFLPLFSVDGLDLAWTRQGDDARWRLKALYGRSRPTVPIGTTEYVVEMDQVWSLVASREAGPWRSKLGVAHYTIGNNPDKLMPLLSGLAQIAAASVPGLSQEAADLGQALSFAGSHKTFLSLGTAYDDGTWLAQAEAGKTWVNRDIAGANTMAYAMLGRRIGDWTPYFMASVIRPDTALKTSSANWGNYEDLHAIALNTTNHTTRFDQHTWTLGTRWDFHDHAALKLQWDRIHVQPDGYLAWNWAESDKPRLQDAARVNLFTVSLDFVF